MSTVDADTLPGVLPALLPRLWTFALRLCGNQHEAEDLLQRACVRALERGDQLQAGTSPLSWMFSIVHSIWVNEVRARNLRTHLRVDWDDSYVEAVIDTDARNPESILMSREIIAAVERLPKAQRIVMLMIAVEGLSYAETAEALDVPIGTIMSRLSRGRQTIGIRFGKRNAPIMRAASSARCPREIELKT